MLYATTRSNADTYTAFRALTDDRAPGGSLYLPFRMPVLTNDQLEQIATQSFGQTVAQILNLFFSAKLTGWDVDCCIGKSPAKLITASHRAVFVNLWSNPQGDYSYFSNALYKKLILDAADRPVSQWAQIAIEIAVLFGIYGQVRNSSTESFDMAVDSADLSLVLAVLYARKMGLPIRMVVCACAQSSGLWEMVHKGSLNTASEAFCRMKEQDASCCDLLERLICDVFDSAEACRFAQALSCKKTYLLRPDMQQTLSSKMYVCVAGEERIVPVISSIYKSSEYVLDPSAAVALSALQDFRAKTGESCNTLILCKRCPIFYGEIVHQATGLSQSELQKKIIQI